MNDGLNELIVRIIWNLFEWCVFNAQYIIAKFTNIVVEKMRETPFRKFLLEKSYKLYDMTEYYTF
jgi:hypothetical protein